MNNFKFLYYSQKIMPKILLLPSFTFFFSLGYGAGLLAPVFNRPRAWQVLDAGIGVVMLALAVKLLLL